MTPPRPSYRSQPGPTAQEPAVLQVMASSDQSPGRGQKRTKVPADRAGTALRRSGPRPARWEQRGSRSRHVRFRPLEVTMMNRGGRPTRGTFRAGCARWLGLDRNPLRRTVDRVETFVRLTALILLLAGVPAGAIVAGRIGDQVFLHQAHAQQSSDHQITAVLSQN